MGQKNEIKAKKVGKNLIVIIGDKKLTKSVTKEEAESITTKILIYNKRNSKDKLEEIEGLMDTVKKGKELVVAKTKGLKKAVKKTKRKAKVEPKKEGFVDKLKKIVRRPKKDTSLDVTTAEVKTVMAEEKTISVEQPKAMASPRPYRGEY